MEKARSLDSYDLQGANLTIKPGDTVLMKSMKPGKKPNVAKVEKIERSDGDGQVKVHVQWYCRPEASICGRFIFHGYKELFLSDQRDVQNADIIERKCTVHSLKAYTKLEAIGLDDFYCRYRYNSVTGAFSPDQVVVYCKCEMPYNPDQLMVECGGCKERFHPRCIGMTIEEAKRLTRCSDLHKH